MLNHSPCHSSHFIDILDLEIKLQHLRVCGLLCFMSKFSLTTWLESLGVPALQYLYVYVKFISVQSVPRKFSIASDVMQLVAEQMWLCLNTTARNVHIQLSL